jgi:hypothetical protein
MGEFRDKLSTLARAWMTRGISIQKDIAPVETGLNFLVEFAT